MPYFRDPDKRDYLTLTVKSERPDVPWRAGAEGKARYGLPSETFGSYQWQIHHRVAHDVDFRSLCEEHEDALEALTHFRASEAPNQRTAEYASLVEELQKDILRELKRS